MPRVCTICAHPERVAIDEALVHRQPFRQIAARYGVSTSALVRHHDHVIEMLTKAREARETARADDLLDQILELRDDAKALMADARAAGEFGPAVSAVREARCCVETLAKLAGRLQEQAIVNIILSPEWHALRAALLTALADHPEARLAVAEALARLEASL